MAIKGLSIPVVGKYSESNGVVTYTDGMIGAKAVSYGVSLEINDPVPLYADNELAEESKQTFRGGKLTLGTDEMPQALSKFLLGLKEYTRTYGPSSDQQTVTELIYDEDLRSPFLGYGIIEEHQISGVDKYRAVILKKVRFNIPEEAATTRGETVAWQTKSIEADIFRSGEVTTGSTVNVVRPWKTEAWFDSEADAIDYLKSMLGVSAA